MRITKSQIKKIIQEEIGNVLDERAFSSRDWWGPSVDRGPDQEDQITYQHVPYRFHPEYSGVKEPGGKWAHRPPKQRPDPDTGSDTEYAIAHEEGGEPNWREEYEKLAAQYARDARPPAGTVMPLYQTSTGSWRRRRRPDPKPIPTGPMPR
jgi:hypothetical protein